ncbi:hypothetical protein EK21DRAFT_45036, partial [Setomelanomma holmii]
MSDYGDDYSDYGDEWFYVEDEYMAADDLAEHAVASPPPTSYGDEDMQPDWDRFDYFNDLEYASDGYDDASLQPQSAKELKIGAKRKRGAPSSRSKKRRKTTDDDAEPPHTEVVAHAPVVWMSQEQRQPKQKVLADNAQSYALLKDWRETLADTPSWARGPSPEQSPNALPDEAHVASASELPSPASEVIDEAALADEDVEEGDDEEGDLGISQDALMAALQKQLATAGGPLAGMDPQQLLQFAMRMATDKDAGDDIAGEMAEAMLEGEDEEDEGNTEENLLSWVAQQRNANKDGSKNGPRSPEEAKSTTSLKRKADEEVEAEESTKTTKKRATRSFDAPTAASEARAA